MGCSTLWMAWALSCSGSGGPQALTMIDASAGRPRDSVRARPAAAAARAFGFGALLEPAQHALGAFDVGARFLDLAFDQADRLGKVLAARFAGLAGGAVQRRQLPAEIGAQTRQ